MRVLLTALLLSGLTVLPACATQSVGPGGAAGTTDSGGSGGSGGATTTASGGSGGATGGAGGQTTSSSTSSSTTTTTTTTVNNCGNAVKDAGEQCDGADFGGKTCESIGFAGGQLKCNNFCAIVASGCTPPENCSNSQDDDDDFQVDCFDSDCAGQPVCLDSCASPFVAAVPFSSFSDTTGRPSVQSSSCSPAEGPELVFEVTAIDASDLIVSVQSWGGPDFTVSVRTSCGDQASEIHCQNAVGPGDFNAEQFKITMAAGQTYFIIVDGTTVNDFGSFDINLQIPQPEGDFECDNHFDDDLDGYLDCDDATNCQSLSVCVPGDQPPGSQCFSANECQADASDPICLGPVEGFSDGYCSEFCDLASPACSGDGICADPVAVLGKAISIHGICLDACSGAGDCRPGYECVDRGLGQKICVVAPEKQCDDFQDNDLDDQVDCQDFDCQSSPSCNGGAKAAGQPCVSSAECFSNASDPVCINESFFGYPGGYCSQFCNPVSDDCGPGGLCIQNFLPVNGATCLDTCASQQDCRPGYSCVDFGFPSKVCIF